MLSEKTYGKIKNMIYAGRLKPGQRLVERDLSRIFAVSRVPLRECLIRLESEGLVRKVAHTAKFVEDFSPKDILEIYSMRLLLEPLAARIAAYKCTPALIRQLRKLCERMARNTEARDWAKHAATDYQFHRTIVEASKHRRLIRAYDCSHLLVTVRRFDFAHLKQLLAYSTAREHLQIVAALEKGDGKAAERTTYRHVRKATKALAGHLRMRMEELP